MNINLDRKDIKNFIVVGDRVLIKPRTQDEKTKSGLYLPPNVKEKENVHTGYIIKSGPGYPIPAVNEIDEPWKENKENVKYVPLQAREGDLAIYLQRNTFEIEFNKEKYIICPASAILLLIRDESLFE